MTALEGLRVLDMTQYEAGTSCTQALAFMGADVVKVERPGTGDPGRGVGPGGGNSEYFVMWNSNKRSITLALDTLEGRQTLLDMLPKYDVFVENYGPGVVEKLNIDYEVMREVHPSIIYARIKGFGTSGPYSSYKCFDMVAQAASGAFSITGYPDGPPMRPGPTIGDAGTGVQAALAVTAAYVQKLKTGKGQLIEVAMQEAMTYYLRTAMAGSAGGQSLVGRQGNGAGASMCLYPSAGGGPNDHVYVRAVTERMWQDLMRAIGRADVLTDERFADPRGRFEHADELKAIVGAWTAQRGKYEAMAELSDAGVPASAVLDSLDLYKDPHLVERGFIHEVEHEARGPLTLLGWPPRMSESEVEMKAAPLLGQHTEDIVAADLGLDPAGLEDLKEKGVFG